MRGTFSASTNPKLRYSFSFILPLSASTIGLPVGIPSRNMERSMSYVDGPGRRLGRSRRNFGQYGRRSGTSRFFLFREQSQLFQAMGVRFAVAAHAGCLMRRDLVVECIRQDRPFPWDSFMLKGRHVR